MVVGDLWNLVPATYLLRQYYKTRLEFLSNNGPV